MEIKEIGEKVTKSFGKNGKYIALGLGGVVLLVLLTNRNNSEDSGQWVTPTGYTSYPDAVTNANVIMAEVNNHTTAEIGNLKDSIDIQYDSTTETLGNLGSQLGSLGENMNTQFEGVNDNITGVKDSMNLQFGVTQDYIKDGVNSIITNANANKDQIVDQIVSSEGHIKQQVTDNKNMILGSMHDNTNSILGQITESQNAIQGTIVGSQSAIQDTILKNSNKSSGGSKKTTSTTNTSTTNTSTGGTSYYKKTSYSGNSLVDGLKSIGVYVLNGLDIGNWKSRTELAQANGIKHYSGTAKQNTKLLNLLKQGKLKKA